VQAIDIVDDRLVQAMHIVEDRLVQVMMSSRSASLLTSVRRPRQGWGCTHRAWHQTVVVRVCRVNVRCV